MIPTGNGLEVEVTNQQGETHSVFYRLDEPGPDRNGRGEVEWCAHSHPYRRLTRPSLALIKTAEAAAYLAAKDRDYHVTDRGPLCPDPDDAPDGFFGESIPGSADE